MFVHVAQIISRLNCLTVDGYFFCYVSVSVETGTSIRQGCFSSPEFLDIAHGWIPDECDL